MKKVFLTFFFMVCLNLVYAQQNAEGWTILDPINADKVIYVSSSSGNDNNGEVYNLPSAVVGIDPFIPSSGVLPFKTVEAAVAGLSNGEAVWVLLKRGDVFTSGLLPISGKSLTRPFLYSSYGTSAEPPLLKTGAESGVAHCCKTLEHFWVVGLSFYAQTRDPDHPEFMSDTGDRGFYFESVRGDRVTNILLEGNVFRYYKDNVIQAFNGTGIVSNIKLRRNMILDGYNSSSSQSESVGLYVHNVTDILLEENIFDHNGWLIPSYGNSEGVDGSNGQATQFSHNTYFVDSQNVTFRNNSFNRPSSNATKWVSSGTARMQNVTIEGNLFNDCEIGISMGTNYPEGSYRFKDISIWNNIIVDQGRSNLTKRQLSWGIDMDDWDGGSFSNNILTSQHTPSRSGFGVQIAGETRGVTIAENIFYDLRDRRGILVSDKGSYQNITLTKNSFVYGSNFKRFVRLEHPSLAGLTFDRNNYYDADNILRPFVILDVDYEYNEWTARFPGENSTVSLPDYPDPTRDLDRYITEVLGLSNRQEYYNELRKQNIHNWRSPFAPGVIVNWIQNGFRTGASLDRTPPVPDNGDLPDIFGECQVEAITSPTATDAISGSVQAFTNISFPIKQSTTLIWYFTDESGNTSSQEQSVIISDTMSPVPLVQNLPDLNGFCSLMITSVPTATDECSGNIQAVPDIDIDKPIIESKTINWSFTDLAGNTVSQQQRVIITEIDAFDFEIESLPVLSSDCSITVTEIPRARVGCHQIVEGVANRELNSPIFESTTITWSYNDGNGNSISQQQNIEIENAAPTPVVPSLPDLNAACSIVVTDFPTAIDKCDGIIIGFPNIEFPVTDQQIKEIIWTYVDSSNNSTTQVQNVNLSVTALCSESALSLNDFDIQLVQESCPASADGSLHVQALRPMEYSARLNGINGYDETIIFNEFLNLSNLSPGAYSLCINAAENDVEICKNITILPAEQLNVEVEQLEDEKKIKLSLSGSSSYTIVLNGKSATIFEDEITLDVKTGDNDLEVRGEFTCQGNFKTTISIIEAKTVTKMMVYPNPVMDGLLHIYLKDLVFTPHQFNIASMSGKVVKVYRDFNPLQEEVVINISDVVQGTYILQGVLPDRIYSIKFIKI